MTLRAGLFGIRAGAAYWHADIDDIAAPGEVSARDHYAVIVCYGETEQAALDLRERVLAGLAVGVLVEVLGKPN